jgi:hypothetical protein
MRTINKALPKDYTVVISSDLHLGSATVSEEHISEMVNHVVTTDNCYMLNIGDNTETITPTDKRFNFTTCKYKTVQDQADAVIKLFKPLGKKLLAMGDGNHEKVVKHVMDVNKYIAQQLDVPYGGVEYKFAAYDETTMELMHKMYFHHGYGSIGSSVSCDIRALANKQIALKSKMLKQRHSDCVVMGMGHIHQSLIVYPTSQSRMHLNSEKNGKVKQFYRFNESQNTDYIAPDSRFYFSNACFYKKYGDNDDEGNYVIDAMYEPVEIGYTKIIIQNTKVVEIEFVKV